MTARSLIGKRELRPSPMSSEPPTPLTWTLTVRLRRRTRSAPSSSPEGSPARMKRRTGSAIADGEADHADPGRVGCGYDSLALDDQRPAGLDRNDADTCR